MEEKSVSPPLHLSDKNRRISWTITIISRFKTSRTVEGEPTMWIIWLLSAWLMAARNISRNAQSWGSIWNATCRWDSTSAATQAVTRASRCRSTYPIIWPRTNRTRIRSTSAPSLGAIPCSDNLGSCEIMSELTLTFTNFIVSFRAATKSTIQDQTWRSMSESTWTSDHFNATTVESNTSLSGTWPSIRNEGANDNLQTWQCFLSWRRNWTSNRTIPSGNTCSQMSSSSHATNSSCSETNTLSNNNRWNSS